MQRRSEFTVANSLVKASLIIPRRLSTMLSERLNYDNDIVIGSQFMLSRREFFYSTGSALLLSCQTIPRAFAKTPKDDPLAEFKQPWTKELAWGQSIDILAVKGETIDEKLINAQSLLAKTGGVVNFPAGTYKFREHIQLLNGIILRGEAPKGLTSAWNEKYALGTKFEFPKYQFIPEGDGTSISKAFKGITLAEPGTAANVGVVHIDINRGHVKFGDAGMGSTRCGKNRFVVGCIFRNAAIADPDVPNLKQNQKPWQRFTSRHSPAIDIKSWENLLVANNRLPKSGDDNFTMNGYVILDQKKKETTIDGVVFDYDNRPGMYVNHYNIGGAGGTGPDGTPETHPQGFRKGILIQENYVYHTGRLGIGFSGDGVKCLKNMTYIPDDIWRPTATGQVVTGGSSTNDNRSIEARGWRWIIDGNQYTTHRNWAYDKKYQINDGEGIMHEDHVNSIIFDSELTNNIGNTYLSMYKTAGIDGLLVEGNEISLGDGRQTIANSTAIFVSADRTKTRFPIRRVRILNNKVQHGGILISGDPSEKCEVKGNINKGNSQVKIIQKANAEIANNTGFEISKN
jgi:hypothetical protein